MAALDTQRWHTLSAVLRLAAGHAQGAALGADAHARVFAAAHRALATVNQEAFVPLLACLRLLVADVVRSPSLLLAALRVLGSPAREEAPPGELLAVLTAELGRACWAAFSDCRGSNAAVALTNAFLETALAPELFECADPETRCLPLWCLRRVQAVPQSQTQSCARPVLARYVIHLQRWGHQGCAARRGGTPAVGRGAAAEPGGALGNRDGADGAAPQRAVAALPAGRAGLPGHLAAPPALQLRGSRRRRRLPTRPAGENSRFACSLPPFGVSGHEQCLSRSHDQSRPQDAIQAGLLGAEGQRRLEELPTALKQQGYAITDLAARVAVVVAAHELGKLAGCLPGGAPAARADRAAAGLHAIALICQTCSSPCLPSCKVTSLHAGAVGRALWVGVKAQALGAEPPRSGRYLVAGRQQRMRIRAFQALSVLTCFAPDADVAPTLTALWKCLQASSHALCSLLQLPCPCNAISALPRVCR